MTYASETAKRENAPSYYAVVEGITTEQYATHPVKLSTVTKVVMLDVPSGTNQKLNPLQNRATTGEVRVRLIDVNGKATLMLSTEKASPTVPTWINRQVTVYAGYREEPESEFVPVFSGEVRGIEKPDPQTYELVVVEKKRRYEELLMTGAATTLTQQLNAVSNQGATSVTLKSASNVVDGATYLLYRADGSQYEKVVVVSHDPTTNVVVLTAGLASSWGIASDVFTNCPFLRGNLVNVFYALLTGNFSKNLASTAFPLKEALNSPTGLTLLDADLDLAGIANVRDKFFGEFEVDFLFEKPVKARQFFETEVYPLGFYPTVAGNGKLGIRAFVPPGPELSSQPKVYKQHMVGYPRWRRRVQEHVNKVTVSGDLDLGSGDDVQLALAQDTTDQSNTREVGEVILASGGLRSALEGVSLAQEVAQRILRRWKPAPIEVEVPLIFTKRDLQPGDVVAVSHPDLPDTTTGVLGLTDRLMEAIEVVIDYRAGLVRVKVMETSFGKFAWGGPPTMADFDVASPGEKLYAYWGDSNNKVDAANLVDGYYGY